MKYGGEAGIRTLDRGCLYTLSRRAPSAARPPLRYILAVPTFAGMAVKYMIFLKRQEQKLSYSFILQICKLVFPYIIPSREIALLNFLSHLYQVRYFN